VAERKKIADGGGVGALMEKGSRLKGRVKDPRKAVAGGGGKKKRGQKKMEGGTYDNLRTIRLADLKRPVSSLELKFLASQGYGWHTSTTKVFNQPKLGLYNGTMRRKRAIGESSLVERLRKGGKGHLCWTQEPSRFPDCSVIPPRSGEGHLSPDMSGGLRQGQRRLR